MVWDWALLFKCRLHFYRIFLPCLGHDLLASGEIARTPWQDAVYPQSTLLYMCFITDILMPGAGSGWPLALASGMQRTASCRFTSSLVVWKAPPHTHTHTLTMGLQLTSKGMRETQGERVSEKELLNIVCKDSRSICAVNVAASRLQNGEGS